MEDAILMNFSKIRQIAPVVLAAVVSALFSLTLYYFVQVYCGYTNQQKNFAAMQRKVHSATAYKNDSIVKQRLLGLTKHFINKANAAGLSLSKWTIYDINLTETVTFEKANQILNQCTHTQVAYYQPISLTIKAITEKTPVDDDSGISSLTKDLVLTVQGKFVARQP
ncbi:MAG: hypothetical protein PVI90_06550 [Desulfobacteraceae bacterium]